MFSSTDDDTSKKCQICLTDFELDDVVKYYQNPSLSKICVLQCKHGFHPECIQNWLLKRVEDITSPIKRLKTCPHCRYPNSACQHPWDSDLHLGSYLFTQFKELEQYTNLLETKLDDAQKRLIALREQMDFGRQPETEIVEQNFYFNHINNGVPIVNLELPRIFQPTTEPRAFLRHNTHSSNGITTTITRNIRQEHRIRVRDGIY